MSDSMTCERDRERERDFRIRIKDANSFSLPTQIKERIKIRRSLNKNVTVISIIVQRF